MSVTTIGARAVRTVRTAVGVRVALTAVTAGALLAVGTPAPAALPRPVGPSATGTATTGTAPDCHGGYSRDGGALACFVPYGEHLWVCDTRADGHHPGVAYRVNGGSWVYRDYDLGNGNCRDIDLDIAESGYIELVPRNYEGSTMVSDGPTFRVSAQG
ncbi:hypothetical protein CA850_26575 [Micromonospora echinospora]|uniref:Peptidase inhibitor family I36 n=1 Tax=Micromonospora echinospora TaxID=1877 RepID=A0A1C4XPK5_MICEC|nr:hypothetical protein [Micromonospora echinospora]OZV76640.1 hypothetical protein CA850_26575 [Micromonospora echinospora]SCF10415.1 hypothetical protein GA0070618_3240 [Micromonospora echinospora]